MIMARSQGACTDDLPGSSVSPLHLNGLLEPDLPVVQDWLFAYNQTDVCDARCTFPRFLGPSVGAAHFNEVLERDVQMMMDRYISSIVGLAIT